MDHTLVAHVRRFHRTVTQRIGALDDAYLSRARPLGQARLLAGVFRAGEHLQPVHAQPGNLGRSPFVESIDDKQKPFIVQSLLDQRP